MKDISIVIPEYCGVLGLYIGRIFDQVKARPIFVVMDELNVEKE